MISQIRNSVFTKILWGLIGLYLLNISVDPADPNPEHFPEDLSFNDQESIVEIIFEQILGYENAIKEYDDHDREDYIKKKNIKTDLLVHLTNKLENSRTHFVKREKRFPDFVATLKNGFDEIDSPPPKIRFVFTT